ncbi:MAG: acetoin utilization protein AcuC [bacterium]
MAADASEAGERLVIVYGPELGSYSFGEEHPLQPGRYQSTMSLLSMLGWLDAPGLEIEPPRSAELQELLAVHSYPYVQAVGYAQAIAQGLREPVDLSPYGLGTADNPLFGAIHDASALCAGATIQAMTALLDERAIHAYNPAGGLHHAMRARASGFCVYNDCAAAIAVAVKAGRRVAYVDLDAHHGDGVQAAFYEDPRVLTVSIHESGRFLFPGTGAIDETGIGEGRGACVNVPLPATAGDDAILQAIERIVEPAVRCFAPDLLVAQTGCDTHHSDPLTDLTATLPLFPQMAARLHRLAHDSCSGHWLIVGGGGYDPADVTPRAWTAFLGTVLGRETAGVELPADWISASRRAGGDPPAYLLEDSGPGYDPLSDGDEPRLLERIEDTALAELRRRHGRG